MCAVEGCGRAFGYKHILQRHQARGHSDEDAEQHSDADGESSEGEQLPKKRKTRHVPSHNTSIIDEITGVAYAKRSTGVQVSPLKCPYPAMEGLPSALPERQNLWGKDATPCEYVFGRAYDLRRHLRAVHGIDLDKEMVDEWAHRCRVRASESL